MRRRKGRSVPTNWKKEGKKKRGGRTGPGGEGRMKRRRGWHRKRKGSRRGRVERRGGWREKGRMEGRGEEEGGE